MQVDQETEWMLYIHFGHHHHKKKLKCENCLDYKLEVCEGKGYKYNDVINCMKEHAQSSEIIMSENLNL